MTTSHSDSVNRPIEKIIEFYTRVHIATDKSSPTKILRELMAMKDGIDAKLAFIKLFDELLEQVMSISLTDDRKMRQIKILRAERRRVFQNLNAENCGTIRRNIRPDIAVETFHLLDDILHAAEKTEQKPFDRGAFATDTTALLTMVSESDLSEIVKGALIRQLETSISMAALPADFSDSDLRKKVKSIYADFCAEFDGHLIKHESLAEKLLRWAKASIGPGVFALALTADATTVSGLLPSPTEFDGDNE
ncbi:MAG: hypothetical protein AAF675_12365 [Pseudomonadota bacterium]